MKIHLVECYLLFANISLIIILGFIFKTSAIIIPIICMFLIIIIIYLFQNELLKQYLIGYLFLNIMVSFIYFSSVSAYEKPFYLGGSDDEKFEELAYQSVYYDYLFPEEIDNHILEQYSVGAGYVSFLAILMYISDILGVYHTVIPRLMNSNLLIGAIIILNFFVTKKHYLNLTYQKVFTILLICTPNLAFINSHIFRDILNLFQVMLLVGLLYAIVKWKSVFGKILLFLCMIIIVYFMYYTRLQSILFSLILMVPLLTDKLEKYKARILIMGILIFIFAYKYLQLSYYIENYTEYLISLATGLSSVIFQFDLFPFGIVARFIYGLIIPFPNFFNLFVEQELYLLDIVNALIYIGVLIQIIFLPFVFKQILKFNWVTISFISMYLIVIITTFSFRHYVFYYPFLLLLILKGWSLSEKRILILSISSVYLTLFAVMYIVLKLWF